MLRVIINSEGDCVGDYKLREWAGKISHQYSKRPDMEVYISRSAMLDALRVEAINNRIPREEVEILFLNSPHKYFLDDYCKVASENDSSLNGSINDLWSK